MTKSIYALGEIPEVGVVPPRMHAQLIRRERYGVARAAMDFPERVGGLILVAPSIDPELEKVRWFQYPADWQLLSWLVPPALRTSNREVLPLKGELQALLPLWAGISQVVTVIQGEKDVLVPAANADFAVARLVNARVTSVRVPDMNHFVPWTHPSLIEQAILDQLDLLQPAPERASSQSVF